MPLEHSPVTELLIPYLRRDREERAATQRAVRSARAARARRGAERGLTPLPARLATALRPPCASCA